MLKYTLKAWHPERIKYNRYEVRDLFPWKMTTKMIISCLLNVKKNLKLDRKNLKLDLNLLPKIFFRSNNIHREIDQWNRRRFGTKWNVTIPNSVTPVKPIVCKWIYMSRGNVVKWHTNYTYIKFPSVFSWNCDFEHFFFYKIHDEKCSFLLFGTTRVEHIIWNQHISVNVHIAQILIETIIPKKWN